MSVDHLTAPSAPQADAFDRRSGAWAEQSDRVILDELNHRVKNTLATVQSIAVQTLSEVHDLDSFRTVFEARLLALAQAHDLLSRAHWTDVPLAAVLDRQLAGFGDRAHTNGPDVRLPANAALSMSMVTHELAALALARGILSAPSGRVEAAWDYAARSVRLTWAEHGGADVAAGDCALKLLERVVARDLGGEMRLTSAPGELTCQITLPLDGTAVCLP